MHISSTKLTHKKKAPARSQNQKTIESSIPSDSFRKVSGSVGAMSGALLGRAALVGATAIAGGYLASRFGNVAAVAGSVAGLAVGFKLEQKTKIGRLAGGMVGGVTGYTLGAVAGALGAKPSETMARECQGFSLKKLPSRLLDPKYTSHPRLNKEQAAEGIKHLKPGDIIMTNDDADFQLELMQKMVGGNAHWTHNYLVDNDGTVMDILIGNDGPTRWPLEHAFTDNGHAQILRPKYRDQESIDKTLDYAREQFGKIEYDSKFDMKTDDAQYCQEYGYKALKAGAPYIQVEPSSIFGRELVTAENFQTSQDFEEIWSTGSNFWLNWLSHFN